MSTDQTALEHTESTFNTYSLLLSSRIHIHFLLFGIDQSQRKEETDVMAPACFSVSLQPNKLADAFKECDCLCICVGTRSQQPL